MLGLPPQVDAGDVLPLAVVAAARLLAVLVPGDRRTAVTRTIPKQERLLIERRGVQAGQLPTDGVRRQADGSEQ